MIIFVNEVENIRNTKSSDNLAKKDTQTCLKGKPNTKDILEM